MKHRRLSKRRGQSILEYLVIATLIVAAILLIKPTVETNMNQLYTDAANKTADAADELGNLETEGGGGGGGPSGGPSGGPVF